MSLVIEQRSTSLTSKLKQATLLDNENDVNNNYSSSLSSIPLIVKLKQQTKAFNTHTLSAMVNENNRLKRSMPNSSTRRPSSPAFNNKQQTTTTKRSVTIDNNNNDLTSNIEENLSTKRFKQDDLNSSSSNKVDASVETVSIGLATEPDQLGPCEPGTSVVLEGIVWNETDSGVLVVNVTWRGKTYVGTLLDSTKQDWASPRLTCDSPTSDYDPRSSSKTSRSKRTNAGGNNRCINYHPFQQLSSNSDDRKLRNTIKTRQSKRTNDTSIINNVHNNCSSSSPLTSPYRTNTTFFPSTNNSETQLISCPEAQCYKQFVSIIALNYHLTNTHKKLDTLSTVPIPQANTRDEEDVAHILANVADYVRRPSPRASPEHQRQTTLTWPCPQISSNLVLSSSLNNNEQQTSIPLTTNSEQDIKSTDQFLLHVKDEPRISLSSSSWTNSKPDELNDNKQSLKIPTPPPSSFVPINLTPTIQPPPVSSSPAYSDISDEDPTNDNEKISPSTINLLNDQSLIPNPSWTADMLLQQYGTYMQHVNKELTSNCLNSKTTTPNGTSDSTVKNILDSRCSKSSPPSSLASSSSPPPPTTTNFYNYHPNGIANDTKLSPSILNSLTSPNENLLNPSSR